MGYFSVGDINYHGVPYTIWVGSDPDLAAESWAQQKAHYFPGYQGPDPPGLPITKGATKTPIEPKRDLF